MNRLRPWKRIPLKSGILLLSILAVCYPYPRTAIRHLRHAMDPDAMIDPNAPSLQPLLDELRQRLPPHIAKRDVLRLVEQFVYQRVKYQWDWETWGVSDYLPTVEETLAHGKEDCDGQAVVAASLLRGLGFNAHLAGNFVHMWVATDQGETMSPGDRKAFVATDHGTEFHPEALMELPRAVAFGIAVFPLQRELIVLLVWWVLLLRVEAGWKRSTAALTVLTAGQLLLRFSSDRYQSPKVPLQFVSLGLLIVGVCILLYRSKDTGKQRENRAIPPVARGHEVQAM